MTSGQVQSVLPRWRGFNLTDGMSMNSSGDFREEEFAWIAEFGFDFVRIPLCYRLWIRGRSVQGQRNLAGKARPGCGTGPSV